MHERKLKDEWPKLIAAMHDALDRRLPPREPTVQRLARHWMDLLRNTSIEAPEMLHAYDGSQLLQHNTSTTVVIDRTLLDYLGAALWAKHLTLDEASRLCTDGPRQRDWPRLLLALREEMNCGASVASPPVQQLYQQWESGLDELTRGDKVLRCKWMTAVRSDPALLAAAGVDARLQNYLRRAHLAKEGWVA